MFFDRLDFLLFGDIWGLLIAPFVAAFFAVISYKLFGYGSEGEKPVDQALWAVLLRLLLAVCLIVLSLALVLVSALSGRSADIAFVARVLILVLPFWVVFPIAQIGWLRQNGQGADKVVFRGRILIGGVLAILSLLMVLRSVLMPLAEDPDRMAAVKLREDAIVNCSRDVGNIESEYKVDSILMDASVFEHSSLKELLGARGLRFVELKTDLLKGQKHRNEADVWGVQFVQGDERSRLEFERNIQYVKFDLATMSDPACNASYPLRLGVDERSANAPFAPGTCIRVTPEKVSSASHAIKAIPFGAGKGLIKWSLIEQSSGKVLAGLTSADEPANPVRQRGGSEIEWKHAKYGVVSCRQPYFTWMNALGRASKDGNPKLSLVKRQIELELRDLNSSLVRWRDIEGLAVDVPADAGLPKNLWGEAWELAYRSAEKNGAAGIGEWLINYQTGELLSLQRPIFDGKIPDNLYVAASPFGFMVVFQRKSEICIVRYGFDGRVEWAGRLHVVNKLVGLEARASLAGVEWGDDGVGVYFFDSRVNGSSSSKLLVQIQNSSIGML